eukprot:2795760-Alexandrium_andersonii.AAC.1
MMLVSCQAAAVPGESFEAHAAACWNGLDMRRSRQEGKLCRNCAEEHDRTPLPCLDAGRGAACFKNL